MADLQQKIQDESGQVLTKSYIRSVLHNDLGFRYKKLKKVPYHGNSTRCLLLRQHYAKFILGELSNGIRCINIDQSFLNDTCFIYRGWKRRGQVHTINESAVTPRISLLMAVDTSGRIYLSLTQVNTDAKVFMMFMTKLAAVLTNEDREWRSNTLILMDGARYQSCNESRAHMERLGMRVCISAPYSYSTAAIELVFGWFKADELNQEKLKTGKK